MKRAAEKSEEIKIMGRNLVNCEVTFDFPFSHCCRCVFLSLLSLCPRVTAASILIGFGSALQSRKDEFRSYLFTLWETGRKAIKCKQRPSEEATDLHGENVFFRRKPEIQSLGARANLAQCLAPNDCVHK